MRVAERVQGWTGGGRRRDPRARLTIEDATQREKMAEDDSVEEVRACAR